MMKELHAGNIWFVAMLANEYVLIVPFAYQQQSGLDFFYLTFVVNFIIG